MFYETQYSCHCIGCLGYCRRMEEYVNHNSVAPAALRKLLVFIVWVPASNESAGKLPEQWNRKSRVLWPRSKRKSHMLICRGGRLSPLWLNASIQGLPSFSLLICGFNFFSTFNSQVLKNYYDASKYSVCLATVPLTISTTLSLTQALQRR